ncbi:hypothetical protein [Mucilaginibacter sp.]
MPKYNIIYTAPNNHPYLWDGSELTKLEKTGQENLMFSGKNFKEEELSEAIKACKEVALQMFPHHTDPEIKTVEINVST